MRCTLTGTVGANDERVRFELRKSAGFNADLWINSALLLSTTHLYYKFNGA